MVVLDDGLGENKSPIAGVIQQKTLTRPIEELILAHFFLFIFIVTVNLR